MWWSKTLIARILLLATVAALGPSGCGFHPLYSRGGGSGSAADSDVSAELAGLQITTIVDRSGQKLRNALLERLTPGGEPATPRYVLHVKLTESETSLGYRKDTFATLGAMNMSAQISVWAGKLVILSDSATTVVNFDYLGPRYGSMAMVRDAEDRAIIQIADDIRRRVAIAVAQYKVLGPEAFARQAAQKELAPREIGGEQDKTGLGFERP